MPGQNKTLKRILCDSFYINLRKYKLIFSDRKQISSCLRMPVGWRGVGGNNYKRTGENLREWWMCIIWIVVMALGCTCMSKLNPDVYFKHVVCWGVNYIQ